MTQVAVWNRFSQVFYPSRVFILLLAAWNTAGQGGSFPNFPKLNDSGAALTPSPLSCISDDQWALKESSCRSDSRIFKLDTNDQHEEQDPQLYVQAKANAEWLRNSTYP